MDVLTNVDIIKLNSSISKLNMENVPGISLPKEDIFSEAFRAVQNFEEVEENRFRSIGPHIKGEDEFFHRLCGGQIVAQTYLAAKKLFPNAHCSKIESSFNSQGTAIPAIEYQIDKLNDHVCHVVTNQESRFLAKSFLRFCSPMLENSHASRILPRNLMRPQTYADLETILSEIDFDKVSMNFHFYLQALNHIKVFEIRPINYKNGFDPNSDVICNWIRLKLSIRAQKIQDPTFVVLMMSDWLINGPAIHLYDNLNPRAFKFYTSLNHKVWMHSHDFDPKGYFLYAAKCEIVGKNHTMIKGHIFDENKRCIATFMQESYIHEHKSKI